MQRTIIKEWAVEDPGWIFSVITLQFKKAFLLLGVSHRLSFLSVPGPLSVFFGIALTISNICSFDLLHCIHGTFSSPPGWL